MDLLTDKELKALPEWVDIEEALKNREKVIRFAANRVEDGMSLARVAELHNLQELSATLSDVSQLLPLLGRLPHLQELTLQACKVADFPETILALPHLRSLSIGNSGLTALPDGIGSLTKLEEMRFMQNSLSQLPDSLTRLTKLRVLGVSYNKLVQLPEEIGNLDALEWLFLDSNRLRRLPESLGKLVRLQTLTLKYNALKSLPDCICQLIALERLELESNEFDTLPSCLTAMPSLNDLSIESEKRSLFMDWSYPHSTKPAWVALEDMQLQVAPGSALHEQLIAAIQESGLTVMSPAIERAARDAVEIKSTVPDDYSQSGGSRLGGFPDLPNPELFPKTDGKYWLFLAQLNLAELAPLNGYLPRSGLLSFFVDSTESLQGKVLFHEGDRGALRPVRHGGGDELFAPEDDYTQRGHRVAFTRFFALPYDPPEGLEEDNAIEVFQKTLALPAGHDHAINGYTYTQHESPMEQAANARKGQPEEWIPLIKLGWDDNVGFCFWDAGTLTFSIHRENLRRGDFSEVFVTLESS